MFTVRKASPADAPYIDALAAKHTHELGFLPRMALMEYLRWFHVDLVELNAEPAGYLLGRDGNHARPLDAMIYQACIQYDARHAALGSFLVKTYIEELPQWTRSISLWCASDLEANLFWQACGFVPAAYRAGGRGKKRTHLFWTRDKQRSGVVQPSAVPCFTRAGQMRAFRGVTPIPAGVDWREVLMNPMNINPVTERRQRIKVHAGLVLPGHVADFDSADPTTDKPVDFCDNLHHTTPECTPVGKKTLLVGGVPKFYDNIRIAH